MPIIDNQKIILEVTSNTGEVENDLQSLSKLLSTVIIENDKLLSQQIALKTAIEKTNVAMSKQDYDMYQDTLRKHSATNAKVKELEAEVTELRKNKVTTAPRGLFNEALALGTSTKIASEDLKGATNRFYGNLEGVKKNIKDKAKGLNILGLDKIIEDEINTTGNQVRINQLNKKLSTFVDNATKLDKMTPLQYARKDFSNEKEAFILATQAQLLDPNTNNVSDSKELTRVYAEAVKKDKALEKQVNNRHQERVKMLKEMSESLNSQIGSANSDNVESSRNTLKNSIDNLKKLDIKDFSSTESYLNMIDAETESARSNLKNAKIQSEMSFTEVERARNRKTIELNKSIKTLQSVKGKLNSTYISLGSDDENIKRIMDTFDVEIENKQGIIKKISATSDYNEIDNIKTEVKSEHSDTFIRTAKKKAMDSKSRLDTFARLSEKRGLLLEGAYETLGASFDVVESPDIDKSKSDFEKSVKDLEKFSIDGTNKSKVTSEYNKLKQEVSKNEKRYKDSIFRASKDFKQKIRNTEILHNAQRNTNNKYIAFLDKTQMLNPLPKELGGIDFESMKQALVAENTLMSNSDINNRGAKSESDIQTVRPIAGRNTIKENAKHIQNKRAFAIRVNEVLKHTRRELNETDKILEQFNSVGALDSDFLDSNLYREGSFTLEKHKLMLSQRINNSTNNDFLRSVPDIEKAYGKGNPLATLTEYRESLLNTLDNVLTPKNIDKNIETENAKKYISNFSKKLTTQEVAFDGFKKSLSATRISELQEMIDSFDKYLKGARKAVNIAHTDFANGNKHYTYVLTNFKQYGYDDTTLKNIGQQISEVQKNEIDFKKDNISKTNIENKSKELKERFLNGVLAGIDYDEIQDLADGGVEGHVNRKGSLEQKKLLKALDALNISIKDVFSGSADNVGVVVTKAKLIERKLKDISDIQDIDTSIKNYNSEEGASLKERRNKIVDDIGTRDTDLGTRYTGTEAVNELKQTLLAQEKTTKEFDNMIYKYEQLIASYDLNINKNLNYASSRAINDARERQKNLQIELENIKRQRNDFASSDINLLSQNRANQNLDKDTEKYREANLKFQEARGKLEEQSFGSKVGRLAQSQMIFMGLATAMGALTVATAGFLVVGIQFDNTVSMMTAVLGDSTKSIAQNRAEFEVLETKLMHLGTVYGGLTKDIDETAISLARGGIDTKDLEQATEISLQLATLTGDTFQNAADAIIVWKETYGNTDGILGKSAEEIEHLGDILAYMANESRGTAHDIATFSSYALEASLSAGLTENAVASLYIAFRNAGQGVSTVGTNVRRFAQILGESKASINKVFIELGVNQQLLANQMKKGGKESEEAMESFIKELNSLSKEDYGRLVRDLQVLDKQVFDSLRNNYNTISKHLKKTSEGVRDELKKSEIAVDNTQKAWERFVNNIKSLSLDMAHSVTDAFQVALNKLNELMDSYNRKKLLLGSAGGNISDVLIGAGVGAVGGSVGGWAGMAGGAVVGGVLGYLRYLGENDRALGTPIGKVYQASEVNKANPRHSSSIATDGMVKAVERALEIRTAKGIREGTSAKSQDILVEGLNKYSASLIDLNHTLKDPKITAEIAKVGKLKADLKEFGGILRNPNERGTRKDQARSGFYDTVTAFLRMVGYKVDAPTQSKARPTTIAELNLDKSGNMSNVCRAVGTRVGGYAHDSRQRYNFNNTNQSDGNRADCSAFTQTVYAEAIKHLNIGGTTVQQMAVARRDGYVLKDYGSSGGTMRNSQMDIINAPEGSLIYMGSKDGSKHVIMRTDKGVSDVSSSRNGYSERTISDYAKNVGNQKMLMITNPMRATSPNTKWNNPFKVTESKIGLTQTQKANIQSPEEKLEIKLNSKSQASAEALSKELSKWKIDDKKTAKENQDEISKLYNKYISDEKGNLNYVAKDSNADAETKTRIKEYISILNSKKSNEVKSELLSEKSSDEPLEAIQQVLLRVSKAITAKDTAFAGINEERKKVMDIFAKEKVSSAEAVLKEQKETLKYYEKNRDRFVNSLETNKAFDMNPYYSNKKGDLEAYNSDKANSIKGLNDSINILKSSITPKETKLRYDQVVTTTVPAVTKIVQKEVVTNQPDIVSKTTSLTNVEEATKSLLNSTKVLNDLFDRGANIGYYSDIQSLTGDVKGFKKVKGDERLEKFNLIDEKLKTLTKGMVENNNKELKELQDELSKLQSEGFYTVSEEGRKALKYQIDTVKKNIKDIQAESDTILNLSTSLQQYKKTDTSTTKGAVDKKYVDVVVEVSPETLKEELKTTFKTILDDVGGKNSKYSDKVKSLEAMIERYGTKALKDTDNNNSQPHVYTQINDNIRTLSYDIISDNMKEIGQLKSDMSFLAFEDIYTFTDKGILALQEEKLLLEAKIKRLEEDNKKLYSISPTQKLGNKVTETDVDMDYIDKLKEFSKALQDTVAQEKAKLFSLNSKKISMSGYSLDDTKAKKISDDINKSEKNIGDLESQITEYEDKIQDTIAKIETRRQNNNGKLLDMFKKEREEAFAKYSEMFSFLELEAGNINKLEALIRAKEQIKKEDRQNKIDLGTPRSIWNQSPLVLNGVDTIEEQIYASSGKKYDPIINDKQGQYEASKDIGTKNGVDFTKFESAQSFDIYSNSQAGSGAFETEAERATMLEAYKLFEEAKTSIAQLEEGKRQAVQQASIKFALDVTSDGFGRMADVAQKYYDASGKKSKTAFKVYQAMSAAQALIATYDSANKAYDAGAKIHPAVGTVYAAMAIASGLMNVALIKQQTYHTGGYVSNGSDSNLRDDEVNAKLLKGEYVLSRQDVYNIKNTQEAPQSQQSSSNSEVVILNSVDPKLFSQYLSSREGRKIIRNIVNA